jgi:hypothetical protein
MTVNNQPSNSLPWQGQHSVRHRISPNFVIVFLIVMRWKSRYLEMVEGGDRAWWMGVDHGRILSERTWVSEQFYVISTANAPKRKSVKSESTLNNTWLKFCKSARDSDRKQISSKIDHDQTCKLDLKDHQATTS